MFSFINLPAKILRLLEGNISPEEIAAGVCLGMFLGFTPLNGPMAILLLVFFLFFKLNRLSTILVLPLFKLFYIAGVSRLADLLGGIVLIDAGFMAGFWRVITGLPIIAYLDLNNTLVAGGLTLSAILCAPVFMGARKAAVVIRAKYGDKLKNTAFIKWFRKFSAGIRVFDVAAKVKDKVS